MGPRQCEVCKEAQSKYKCPSCLVPYCSLACFKKHKEILCKKSMPPVEEPTPLVRPHRLYPVDEQSWVLHKEQLRSVVESNEIREALKDGELRKLIQTIDYSQDPENEFDKAMEGQIFQKFTDKLLSLLSPQEQAT